MGWGEVIEHLSGAVRAASRAMEQDLNLNQQATEAIRVAEEILEPGPGLTDSYTWGGRPDPRTTAVDFALQLKSIKSKYDEGQRMQAPTAQSVVDDADAILQFLLKELPGSS